MKQEGGMVVRSLENTCFCQKILYEYFFGSESFERGYVWSLGSGKLEVCFLVELNIDKL